MKSREFIAWSLVSFLFGLVITLIYDSVKSIPKQDVVQTKDSLNDEFYKKQLDSTYPFEHSKIPVDGK